MNLQRILVATDFSAAGQRAVQLAAAWARHHRAALRLVHVAPHERWLTGLWGTTRQSGDSIGVRAVSALKRIAEECDPTHAMDISTAVLLGHASQQVLRAAGDYDCDLLVIGARGERAAAVSEHGLGGTSTKLLQACPVPLLLVHEAPVEDERVLAAVDLSPLSSAVIAAARVCARSRPPRVFHAYSVPFESRLEAYGYSAETIAVYSEDEQARRQAALAELVATERGLETHCTVRRGDAAKALLQEIHSLAPSLVVLGQHSRKMHLTGATAYGSVCNYVVSLTTTNALIIPATVPA